LLLLPDLSNLRRNFIETTNYVARNIMLGRNQMRFNRTRLRETYRLLNPLLHRQIGTRIFVCITCVICVAGCSRLGSNGPLSQRKIPFPPQPLRSAPSQTAVAQQSKTMESVKTTDDGSAAGAYDLANDVRTETSPARDAVQNLRARPPKLSQLPRTTLYAEPVIDNAQQVAFQEAANEFDPAAQPPAEIFAQPLAKAKDAQFVDPTTPRPTAEPSAFVVADPLSSDSKDNMLNPIRTGNRRSTESQSIMLVNDQSTEATKETVSEIVATTSSALLNPAVLEKFAPEPLRPVMPVIVEKTPEEVNDGPKVDANLKGQVYSKSVPQPAEKRSLQKQFLGPKNQPEKIATHPVIKDDLPKVAPIIVEDFQTNFSPAETLAKTATADPKFKAQPKPEPTSEFNTEPIDGIEIDPTLGAQRESRLNFTGPRKITKTQPKPAPVDFQKKQAPFLMSPPVTKVLPQVAEIKVAEIKVAEPPVTETSVPRVARIEQPVFTPAVEKDDFLPLKKCVTCDLPDCRGCYIPPENQFSEASPVIDGRRSLAPMTVEHDADEVEIAKKNFGQVSFAPVGLPLPQAATGESENIVAAFNQEVPEEEFVKASTQTDVPPVGVEAVLKLNEVTWRSRLQQTILLVKNQLEEDIDSQTRTSLEINLRLLDVLSRQMGDIAEEQRSFTQSENYFWQHQLEAITSMLQTPELADVKAYDLMKHHTAHDTLVHLRQAIAELESLANLKIESGAFCTEVSGYGQFKTFASDIFKSGQKVLVYCEVENYNSLQQASDTDSESTFHTRLRGSYAIYDSAGHAVQQAEFPVMEDIARRRRRDFYMHLPITIGDLSNGDYELHLLVEDLGGNKTASLTPPLRLTIASSDPVDLQAKAQGGGHLVR
jgi:hypothetical protein